MQFLKTFIFILYFPLCSCSQKLEVNTKPTNLVVNATIFGQDAQNHFGDGSGVVTFNIAATNATSYKISFGNGEVMDASAGNVNYTYNNIGTNTYTVSVSAYNGVANFVSISLNVTVIKVQSLTPVWSDEFNADGAPDSSKWAYDIGRGDGGWGNAELEYYTDRPNNVIVKNGVLKITALKENYQGATYTSTRLKTQNKYSFKYGKVITRAKLPAGMGTWPAIWMLGANIVATPWPACGEIDIMEHVGKELNKIYGTLHYPERFGGNANGKTKMISNATSEFHLYQLDWSATEIKFSVDGSSYFVFANSNSVPFNQNFFLIMNLAIGGNFGGPVDTAIETATMEVDYIRVYQ